MTKKLLKSMKTKRIFIAYLKNNLLVLAFILTVIPVTAQKQMESLDRGVLAVRTSSNQVLVSWRIFASEFTNASYNVYRGTTLLNTTPITGASNYVDNTSTNGTYSVSAIIDGVEQDVSQPIDVWNNIYKKIPITAPTGGTTPDNVSYTYEANDASVGDLDGDGEYEIILKWMPTNSKDNAHSGYTGNTILQGLKMDGTVLWTINLGKNIRSGAHYTQFMVYDLDGDGKAEIACKTADGTMDGAGTVLGDANADYRNSNGYILSGPEYLSLFDGETGAFITTQNYIPARGNVSSWGDGYGNRVDRFLACVAYLDGARPSLVFARGYYTRAVLAAFDYRDGQLTNRWIFDTNDGSGKETVYGQGNHSITVGDVDGDGKDEIQYGSAAIDDNGNVLYSTGFGHGDASHLGDFDPSREGLEYFMVHEEANEEANKPEVPQIDYRDPKTGDVFWSVPGSGDIGRGVIADIDPNHLGAEMWASNGSGIHNLNGDVISTTYPETAGNGSTFNMLAWFDGDLLRELVDRTVITKWNAATGSTNRTLTAYNYDNVSVTSNNGSKSNPCLIADILGDWREEIIWRKSDNTELVIFSTPNPTTERIFTLMHDPLYRTSIAWQNVGYNQPAHTGFYLGVGMPTPAVPDIYLASSTLSIEDSGTKNSSSIKIYPNPTSGELYISGVYSGTIEVYDSMGKSLIKKSSNTINSVDLSTYPKGLYLVKITQETGVKVFKTILK
jgi:rhamnogalacturonan endolyase